MESRKKYYQLKNNLDTKQKVGDFCYFYAYPPGEKDSINTFICGGTITRLPKKESPVFKITITQVFPITIYGDQQILAASLLNKNIPRNANHILPENCFTGIIGQNILRLSSQLYPKKEIKELWIKL